MIVDDYTLTSNGGIIRNDGANIPIDAENRDWKEYLAWCEQGNAANPVPDPTMEDIAAQLVIGVQSWLDAAAQEKNYDSLLACISYKDSAVPGFSADAVAAIAWRDAVWQAAYAMQAQALASPPEVTPTIAEVIASLPRAEAFGWTT